MNEAIPELRQKYLQIHNMCRQKRSKIIGGGMGLFLAKPASRNAIIIDPEVSSATFCFITTTYPVFHQVQVKLEQPDGAFTGIATPVNIVQNLLRSLECRCAGVSSTPGWQVGEDRERAMDSFVQRLWRAYFALQDTARGTSDG